MAGLISSIVKIGSTIIGGNKKKKASKAAQAVYDAKQQEAITQSKTTQDAQEARLNPYSEAGKVGLDKIAAGVAPGGQYVTPFSATHPDTPFDASKFQADPGYAFRKEEGLRALDRTLGARGSLFSGAQIQGAQAYGQNIASEEYQNAYNRYNNDYTNAYNRYNSDVGNDYNRSMGLAQLGYGADVGVVNTLGTEGGDIRSSLIDIGGNDSSGIRERGAITAGQWDNIANEVVSAINSVASGGATDVLSSLKSSLGSSSGSTGQSAGSGVSNVGSSLSSLASIFRK